MIKIESHIWSIIDQNRPPLAYMCQVTHKKDGSVDKATEGKMSTGRKWARNGRTPVYKRDVNGAMINTGGVWAVDHHKEANEGVEAFHDNTPVKGFKVVGEAGRWTTEATYIEILDPRGFKVQVPVGNLTTLIQTCDIIKGEIQAECVWGRDGQHVLLPVDSKEYRGAVKEITAVDESLRLRDLNPGDWVKVHSWGVQGAAESQFLGRVKLEWTQESYLFDTATRHMAWLDSNRINKRDHLTEVVRDDKWVGLFAHRTVVEYVNEAGKRIIEAPGCRIEEDSLKITSRRPGVIETEYQDLNALLGVVYTGPNGSRDGGRDDCPKRVLNKYNRQRNHRHHSWGSYSLCATKDTAVIYKR